MVRRRLVGSHHAKLAVGDEFDQAFNAGLQIDILFVGFLIRVCRLVTDRGIRKGHVGGIKGDWLCKWNDVVAKCMLQKQRN